MKSSNSSRPVAAALPLALSLSLLLAACTSSDPGGGQTTGAGGSGGGTGGTGGTGSVGAGGSGGGSGGAAAGTGGATGAGGTSGADGGGGAGGSATGGSDGGAGDARPDAGPPVVDRTATLSIMKRVADYEIARFASTPTNRNWARAVFYTGLMAFHRASGDAAYLNAARSWGMGNNWALGTDGNGRPLTPADNSRFADNQACVQTYAEIYMQDPTMATAAMLTPATTAFDRMLATPVTGRTEWWWCDALFMAPGAMARVAKALNRPQYVDRMHALFWDTKAYLFSPTQHLFFRDDTFLSTNTFWARGNGWVVGGLARILDALPATDARRVDYQNLLREMAEKLRSVQQADGFWRSDLLNPAAFTNIESSGTAFFTYGMAWGINNGVLDRATYLDSVTRGWNALTSVVNAQGRLGWVQAVGAMPGPATEANTNDYATGAFLLGGEQMLRL